MKNVSLIFCCMAFLFCNCHSQTNKETINETTRKVIVAIRNSNPSNFKDLIGITSLRVIGIDETIGYDVHRYNLIFNQAFNKIIEVPFDVTGLFNGLGQTVVRIKFPQRIADSFGSKSLHLNLFFGPPPLVSLKKISGYELIQNNSDSTEFKIP